MMEFRAPDRVNFPLLTNIRQQKHVTVTFSDRVKDARAVLNGFNIHYDLTGDNDQSLFEEEINLSTTTHDQDRDVGPNDVRVTIDFVLRDDSSPSYGNAYGGWVDLVVLATV